MRMSAICVFMLMVLSGVVFIGQVRHANVWLYICAYWFVVLVKNLLDWVASHDQ